MIDFTKRLGRPELTKKIDPLDIYENLDRATEKSGPLRPAQIAVLTEWHKNLREQRDTIVKLHTGQGKTLIGLLMLQSKINETGKPALYLCPNKFLIQQTCHQAKRFGIKYVTIQDDLPEEFIDGKTILITSVHKLFNGITKFGLGPKSLSVSTILMDDSHACIDVIKQQCTIQLTKHHPAFQEILTLFGPSLEAQGSGTYNDILNGDYESLLPVPYWEWQDKYSEVASILSKYNDQELKASRRQYEQKQQAGKISDGKQLALPNPSSGGLGKKGKQQEKQLEEIKEDKGSVKYVWPILKDNIANCHCLITGTRLEIAPYHVPLFLFGTYHNAKHRIFMSATVTEDSFLVKGLGLSVTTIQKPLGYEKERWSGEKMIIIPSLISETLDRATVAKLLSTPRKSRNYGVVALVPSFRETIYWKLNGGNVTDKDNIYASIDGLRNGNFEKILVIANRYDGIDLPDETCRILILDGKPFAESLADRYMEERLGNSDVIATKVARIIEQGLGRSVRGEKDYSVIVLMGSDLIRTMKTESARKFFSSQTRTQIEIGRDIAKFSEEALKAGEEPQKILLGLVEQCLSRDEGWKQFYKEQMDRMPNEERSGKTLEIFAEELRSETSFHERAYEDAVRTTQTLIDKHFKDAPFERGWYLQEMARYTYPRSASDSNRLQISAHKSNPYLLRPREGMEIVKLQPIGQRRIENIRDWMQRYSKFDDMILVVEDILSKLAFGVEAERFEHAFNALAATLGFSGQRPEKEWKAGPDNLWILKDGEYLLVECKNEVELTRSEINKTESGQMNNACAWFEHNYPGATVKRVMIINTRTVAHAAGFNKEVSVMREGNLRRLVINVRKFYGEFKNFDLKDVSNTKFQELLSIHKLTAEDLAGDAYAESVRVRPAPNASS